MKTNISATNKFLVATSTVAVAVAAFSPIPFIFSAHAQGTQEEVVIFKGVKQGEDWVKTGEAITNFDFSSFEAPLRSAGEAQGLELVDANIKLVNLSTSEEIDFGSLTQFKKEAKSQIKDGNNYEFHIQGVYTLVGENADPDPITSDFTPSGYVIVADSSGEGSGGEGTGGDGSGTGGSGSGTGGDGSGTGGDGSGTGGSGSGTGGEGSGVQEVPNEVKNPVVVENNSKNTVIKTEDVTVDAVGGVTDPEKDKVGVDLIITPEKDMEDVSVSVTEKDPANGGSGTPNEPVFEKDLGNLTAGESVKVPLPLENPEDKEYFVKIESANSQTTGVIKVDALQKEIVFKDVPTTHWAYKDVMGSTKLGIVNGYVVNGENYFKPSDDVTRAQALVMVLRSLNIPYEGYKGKGFEDAKGTWYESAAAKAKDLGITVGYSDKELRGDEKVSREQLAVFISRAYLDRQYAIQPQQFPDIPKTKWSFAHIGTLNKLGVINGFSDGKFKPLEHSTRAQTVSMIMRVLRSDSDMVDFNKFKEKKTTVASLSSHSKQLQEGVSSFNRVPKTYAEPEDEGKQVHEASVSFHRVPKDYTSTLEVNEDAPNFFKITK